MARQSVFLWLLLAVNAWAEVLVSTPPGVIVSMPAGSHKGVVQSDLKTGTHRLTGPALVAGSPIEFIVQGPYGGRVKKHYTLKEGANFIEVGTGIVSDKRSNPEFVDVLPALCPRVESADELLTYLGSKDLLNHVPTLQLLDPDARAFPAVDKTTKQFDCRHVLLVDQVKIIFDYEDPSRLKAESASGDKVWENFSGFYSNFHIAVLPYRSAFAAKPQAELLRYAEGRASELALPLPPFLVWRTHSFLPGPYLSHSDFFYTLCEWGDTAFQAPLQALAYKDFAIWDWDYPVGQTVLIVVWEGDEENFLVSRGLLAADAIMDDWVAAFVVSRGELDQGKTLVNDAGNFAIRLRNGDLTECR